MARRIWQKRKLVVIMTTIRQCAPVFSGTGSVTPEVRVGTNPVFTTAPTTATVTAGGTIDFIATDNLDRALTYELVAPIPSGYSITTIA